MKMHKNTDITIEVFQGIDGLEALRSSWEEIVMNISSSRRFFHNWQWHMSHLKCLVPEPDSIHFFLFTKEKTPMAILPLQENLISVSGRKMKSLTFPQHSHVSICDLICHREALFLPLFHLLCEYLKYHGYSWDMILIPHILEDSCAIRVLRDHRPPLFILRNEGVCNYLDASVKYETYASGLNRNFRKSLKRTVKLINQMNDAVFHIARNGPELKEGFKNFLDVEASGWKGAHGTASAIKLNPDLFSFYLELIALFSDRGQISIATLKAEGKCVAALFSILVDRTEYILKIGYDEDFKRLSPGNYLHDSFIRYCMADHSIKEVNYVTGPEWLAHWKPLALKKSELYIFRGSVSGIIGFTHLKMIEILQKIYQAHVKPRLSERIQKLIGKVYLKLTPDVD